MQFANIPDFESPADSGGNNVYNVTVQATDSNNNKGTHHVDVIVKNVDEPPELTGPNTVDNFPGELREQPAGRPVLCHRPGAGHGHPVSRVRRHGRL